MAAAGDNKARFLELTRMPYVDQAKWYLNAFWKVETPKAPPFFSSIPQQKSDFAHPSKHQIKYPVALCDISCSKKITQNVLVTKFDQTNSSMLTYCSNNIQEGAEQESEAIWKFTQKFIELDTTKKKEGNELDEFHSHKVKLCVLEEKKDIYQKRGKEKIFWRGEKKYYCEGKKLVPSHRA